MDGVLCDYESAKIKALKENPDIKYPQCQMDFFRKLEPLPFAIRAVNELREHYDVYILSSPSYKNPLSYTEKMLWLKDHFDEEFAGRLILSRFKHLNKGDYLIDDRPDFNGAGEFEGEVLHFGEDGDYRNWESIIRRLFKTTTVMGYETFKDGLEVFRDPMEFIQAGAGSKRGAMEVASRRTDLVGKKFWIRGKYYTFLYTMDGQYKLIPIKQ